MAESPVATSCPFEATPAAAATASVAVVETAAVVTLPNRPKSGESLPSKRETTSAGTSIQSGGLVEPPSKTASVVKAASGITASAVNKSRKLVSGMTALPRKVSNRLASKVMESSVS